MNNHTQLQEELLEISNLITQENFIDNNDISYNKAYDGHQQYYDFILENKKNGLLITKIMIENGQIEDISISEMLNILGKVKDPETYDDRINLLVDFLNSSLDHARLGAIQGLMEMYPSKLGAVNAINNVATEEQQPIIRHLAKQIIKRMSNNQKRGIYG